MNLGVSTGNVSIGMGCHRGRLLPADWLRGCCGWVLCPHAHGGLSGWLACSRLSALVCVLGAWLGGMRAAVPSSDTHINETTQSPRGPGEPPSTEGTPSPELHQLRHTRNLTTRQPYGRTGATKDTLAFRAASTPWSAPFEPPQPPQDGHIRG